MKLFRDKKEKYIFSSLLIIILSLSFFSLFFINKSYALPDDLYLNLAKKNNNLEANIDYNNLKRFGLIALQGELFPKTIDLRVGDSVCLELNALDDNYSLILNQEEIKLKQGEMTEYYFKTKKKGEISLNIKNNSELSKLIIN